MAILAVIGGVVLVGILTLVIVLTIARCEKKRLDRLLKTTKVDVGDSDEDEEEKLSSQTPDVVS